LVLPGIFLFEGCSRVKYANDANFKLNMFLNWTHLLKFILFLSAVP